MRSALLLFLLVIFIFSKSSFANYSLESQQKLIKIWLADEGVDNLLDELDEELLDNKCEKLHQNNNYIIKDHILSLDKSIQLENFSEVYPDAGLYRMAVPSPNAAALAKINGTCQAMVTLTAECRAYDVDPTPDGKVSKTDRPIILNALLSQGLNKGSAIAFVDYFYSKWGKICHFQKQNSSWHHRVDIKSSTKNLIDVFRALNLIYELKSKGLNVCFHCSVGKHRTGIVSMLLELAQSKNITDKVLQDVYNKYRHHTWFKAKNTYSKQKCSSKSKTQMIIPFILKTNEFKDFRKKWQIKFN